jgi:class 3 adenylate cyclase/pimeloyl-ACP methyl ester carboxylesterase
MSGIPQTRYAQSHDGTYLAYQAFGEGDRDVLYVPGFMSHLEVFWEFAPFARFMERLASFARVIWFDKRGTGMSDRVARLPGLDEMLEDVRAVLAAVGSERTVVWGEGADGGGACALYAASHPDRTLGLIWWAGYSRAAWAPDYPWGMQPATIAEELQTVMSAWGDPAQASTLARFVGSPGLADDPVSADWLAKVFRYAGTPAAGKAQSDVFMATDVRSVLPTIQVPTLVLSRGREPDEARFTTSKIPGATLVQLEPTKDFPSFMGEQDGLFNELKRFLDNVMRERAAFERVLATVLFTDIVDSTAQSAAIGDRQWREVREQHDRLIRAALGRFRGKEVKTMGDGFLATFDGPARAVHCAQAIVETVRPLGIEVRAGLHTGEVELDGDDVAGIAVAIGARVGAKAGPSEVLVSQTVKDLVAGSGLTFAEAGEHELKGVPDRWRLYRLVA